MLLFFSIMFISISLGMLFLKLKRGYTNQGDIVLVSVIFGFTSIVGISTYMSMLGYILSVSSLLK